MVKRTVVDGVSEKVVEEETEQIGVGIRIKKLGGDRNAKNKRLE